MSRETKILLAVLAGALTGIAFGLFSLWFLIFAVGPAV